MAATKLGCLKSLLLLFLAGAVIAWIVGEWFFNVGSNLVAVVVRNTDAALEVRTRRGVWKPLASATPMDMNQALYTRYNESGLRWSTLRVRRSINPGANFIQKVLGSEVEVITFSPDQFEFMTSYRPKFQPTTAAERMEAEGLWFAITANFRDPKGKPLGWVWHDGLQVNPPFPEWSGAFFVKNGRPWFGPRSLVEEVPGAIQEGSQGYPSVMKNHTVFPYVDLKPDQFFDGSKITYRALAGMRRDGTIVFILSGDGGVMKVTEVTEIARKLDLQHATLLDGGRALQYSLRTEDGPWHFTAYNTRLPIKHRWLEQQQSPVFIGVRRRAPQIISMHGK